MSSCEDESFDTGGINGFTFWETGGVFGVGGIEDCWDGAGGVGI